METIIDIPVKRTQQSALDQINWDSFQFGEFISDHMFESNYINGEWTAPHIKPYGNLSMSPLTLGLHYGQSIFEGMKAFRTADGRVNIFRMEKHYSRLNQSLKRMCMAQVPEELFMSALQKLVELDSKWVPAAQDSALYLRPIVFASEARLGVKVSEEYKFLIITGPVPILYQKPISVKIERKFIRAAKGGTGYAKCAGNYGGSFYPTQKAREEGFDQVMWTDAFEHEYIEESGTMNLMFISGGKLVTPPVSDSILDGVTRDSLLQVAELLQIPVEERPVSVKEIRRDIQNGTLTEVFGAGTAAVIAPISSIGIDGDLLQLPEYSKDSMMFKLKKVLEDIRTGRSEDVFGWNHIVA